MIVQFALFNYSDENAEKPESSATEEAHVRHSSNGSDVDDDRRSGRTDSRHRSAEVSDAHGSASPNNEDFSHKRGEESRERHDESHKRSDKSRDCSDKSRKRTDKSHDGSDVSHNRLDESRERRDDLHRRTGETQKRRNESRELRSEQHKRDDESAAQEPGSSSQNNASPPNKEPVTSKYVKRTTGEKLDDARLRYLMRKQQLQAAVSKEWRHVRHHVSTMSQSLSYLLFWNTAVCKMTSPAIGMHIL